MKSFARFAGSLAFTFIFIFSTTSSASTTRSAWVGLGTVSGIYLTSQMRDGPTLFAGIYSIGALYLMNEYYDENSADYVVPASLLSLGIINIALLHDDDTYTKHDVFVYNLVGMGLITAYALWDHSQWALLPMLKKDSAGVQMIATFQGF